MINREYELLKAQLIETEDELLDAENDNRELTSLALHLALKLLDYKQAEIDGCMCPRCAADAEREMN